MSLAAIRKALLQAHSDVGLGFPTVYDGSPTDKPSGETWARALFLPATGDPVELGNIGRDRIDGILQLDVFANPATTGQATALGWIDSFRSTFKAGAQFTSDGQTVRVRKSDPKPLRNFEGEMIASLDVYWYAYVPRY